MIILPEGTVHEWTKSRSGSDWMNVSNMLMANALTATMRGQHGIADDWRMLSDLAWQHSEDAYNQAYDDAWIEMETQMKSEAA
ncbi:MAG: hypothetical protein MUE59_03770 [Thiobacillaceae bacterium]|jgi:hypothetical protein|nr:hypothetical protein [Thiobacillaceae bacterium]